MTFTAKVIVICHNMFNFNWRLRKDIYQNQRVNYCNYNKATVSLVSLSNDLYRKEELGLQYCTTQNGVQETDIMREILIT